MNEREEGFTLIELLVVIIIIGILAAIAVPTFLKQRNKGWEAGAKSELAAIAIAEETWNTDNSTYTSTTTDLTSTGYNLNADIVVAYSGVSATGYTACAVNKNGGNIYRISNTSGTPVVAAGATKVGSNPITGITGC